MSMVRARETRCCDSKLACPCDLKIARRYGSASSKVSLWMNMRRDCSQREECSEFNTYHKFLQIILQRGTGKK